MAQRDIIRIDEDLCDGCGECASACAEGAIRIVGKKAVVVGDSFCDGMGACIGKCPKGALHIEHREAAPFDLDASKQGSFIDAAEEIMDNKEDEASAAEYVEGPCSHAEPKFGACHGMRSMSFHEVDAVSNDKAGKCATNGPLRNWPIQIRLVSPDALHFKEARLLVAADCTGFACEGISDHIRGHVALIGCPKLDEARASVEKLSQIIRNNAVKEIDVLRMEVPCCGGLVNIVRRAIEMAERDVPVKEHVVSIGEGVSRAGPRRRGA